MWVRRAEKVFANGLREFIEVENQHALDVGSLRRGTGSDVIVRESPDELTLRAEEVRTSKALINVDHIEPERWGLRWLMQTGMPSARRCAKASMEKIGKQCMSLTKK